MKLNQLFVTVTRWGQIKRFLLSHCLNWNVRRHMRAWHLPSACLSSAFCANRREFPMPTFANAVHDLTFHSALASLLKSMCQVDCCTWAFVPLFSGIGGFVSLTLSVSKLHTNSRFHLKKSTLHFSANLAQGRAIRSRKLEGSPLRLVCKRRQLIVSRNTKLWQEIGLHLTQP